MQTFLRFLGMVLDEGLKLTIQGVSEQFLQIYRGSSEVKEGKFKTDSMWSESIFWSLKTTLFSDWFLFK